MKKHIGTVFSRWLGLALMVGSLICFGQAILYSNHAFAAGSDDFNDNSKDPMKWGTDITNGGGKCALNEVNGRLEYTCKSASSWNWNEVDRPWILTEFPYSTDWEMQINTTNTTQFATDDLYAAFGMCVMKPYTYDDHVCAEQYADGYLSAVKGFWAEVNSISDGYSVNTDNVGATAGAIRLAFNSTTKVITVYYDTDSSDGYQWILYGSFDIDGSGSGATYSVNWGLSEGDKLWPFVYGYSDSTIVRAGEIYGDNFQETGGVAPPPPELSAYEGTLGTQIIITGTGFGSKKGKVLLGSTVLKIAKGDWSDTRIVGTISKVPLPAGSYPSSFEIVVQTKDKPPKYLKPTDPFTVRNPWISSHSPASGNPGTEVTVNGTFFGAKKGKVYLESQSDGAKKNCKVTSWAMNEIKFIVPKADVGSYWLYISNKVGTNPPGVPYVVN